MLTDGGYKFVLKDVCSLAPDNNFEAWCAFVRPSPRRSSMRTLIAGWSWDLSDMVQDGQSVMALHFDFHVKDNAAPAWVHTHYLWHHGEPQSNVWGSDTWW